MLSTSSTPQTRTGVSVAAVTRMRFGLSSSSLSARTSSTTPARGDAAAVFDVGVFGHQRVSLRGALDLGAAMRFEYRASRVSLSGAGCSRFGAFGVEVSMQESYHILSSAAAQWNNAPPVAFRRVVFVFGGRHCRAFFGDLGEHIRRLAPRPRGSVRSATQGHRPAAGDPLPPSHAACTCSNRGPMNSTFSKSSIGTGRQHPPRIRPHQPLAEDRHCPSARPATRASSSRFRVRPIGLGGWTRSWPSTGRL